MAFTDPQSITVAGVAKSMPNILRSGTSAKYQMSDQSYALEIRHSSFKRDQKDRVKTLVAFTQRAVVPDPLTAVNDWEIVSISVQFDRPLVGFTATQIDDMLQGLKTSFLTTANTTKLFGQES